MAKKTNRKAHKRISRLERKAYHECGYALVAYLNPIPFKSVSIGQESSSLGKAWLGAWLFPGTQRNKKLPARRIADWIKAAYGGGTAELVVTGRYSWKSYEDDKSLARILAATVSSSEKEALTFQELMFIRARTLLEMRTRWP